MQRKMRRISIIGINMSSSLFLRQSLQRGMNPQFDNGLTYQKTSEQNKTKQNKKKKREVVACLSIEIWRSCSTVTYK